MTSSFSTAFRVHAAISCCFRLARERRGLSNMPTGLSGPNAYYLVYPEHLGELAKVRHFVNHLLAAAAHCALQA